MKKLLLILFCLIFSITVFAHKDKDNLEWKTRKVLDTDSNILITKGGSTTTGQVNEDGTFSSSTNQTRWRHHEGVYIIEGEEYIYFIRRVISFRWEKEASLTVNAPVKYAVSKNMVHFIDDNDQKMKGKIIKKILKEKPQQKPESE